MSGYVTQVEEEFLCPVRALKVYLHRTAHLRGTSKRRFVPVGKSSSGVVSQHSLKSHLLAAIEEAYRAVNVEIPADFSLRAIFYVSTVLV
jgi:hypothetical protein